MKRIPEDVSEAVEQILNSLTLYERAALVTGRGSWHTKDCNGKVPIVTMSDGPHGLRKQDEENYADINQSNPATCFPTGSALSSTWDPQLVASVAEAIAWEAKAECVSVVLGPAVNIKRSPLCGRNFEYYSEDPYLAGVLATAYVQAMESQGVGTSLKHYACNNQETHRQTSNSRVDERALHEIYLKAFRMCVTEAQPSTIMASYNRINGEYACGSRTLLTDILRNSWGYQGAVISDWGATMNIVDCLRDGLDLEMPDSFGFHTEEILDAIDDGGFTEEALDRAVRNVITLALRRETPSEAIPCDYQAHHDLAKAVAADAAVLLKHSGAFPIKPNEKILLVGEMAEHIRYQGGGSSHITIRPSLNIIEALQKEGYQVSHTNHPSSDLSAYDKVIYFGGLTDIIESEGYDRTSIEFPEDQLSVVEKLLDTHPHVSMVSFGGAPFVFPFYERLEDLIHMHLCGQAVGEACALLLTGQVNPSGHLSETWPASLTDVPNHKVYGRHSEDVPYLESVYVGYRYYETLAKPVQFEFGYGLSYTTFSYRDLSVERNNPREIRVTFTMTNTGSVAGANVSQVYIKNPAVNQSRPSITLAGFSKDYLQPGESREITVVLDPEAFDIYDTETKSMQTITGDYTIAVGDSVRRLYLEESIHVDGMDFPEILPVQSHYLVSTLLENGGTFTQEAFDRYYGKEYDDYDHIQRGDYYRYHSMERVCHASLFGRMLLGLIEIFLPLALKTPRNDPASKMIVSMMREAPLDSLVSVGGGVVKPNLTESLVLHANGHPIKGWIRLLSGNRKKHLKG